jgi:hypothetical protein
MPFNYYDPESGNPVMQKTKVLSLVLGRIITFCV